MAISGHACAARTDGTVSCPGEGEPGQFGTGDKKRQVEPAEVRRLRDAAQVALGPAHACAVRADGLGEVLGQLAKRPGWRRHIRHRQGRVDPIAGEVVGATQSGGTTSCAAWNLTRDTTMGFWPSGEVYANVMSTVLAHVEGYEVSTDGVDANADGQTLAAPIRTERRSRPALLVLDARAGWATSGCRRSAACRGRRDPHGCHHHHHHRRSRHRRCAHAPR